jgi:N-methylhydantoinase A
MRRSLPVLARDELQLGQQLTGPLVVEDAASTLVLPAGATARRDGFGNLIIDLDAPPGG